MGNYSQCYLILSYTMGGKAGQSQLDKYKTISSKMWSFFSPNPPKDTDGRREESGRGMRELQARNSLGFHLG